MSQLLSNNSEEARRALGEFEESRVAGEDETEDHPHGDDGEEEEYTVQNLHAAMLQTLREAVSHVQDAALRVKLSELERTIASKLDQDEIRIVELRNHAERQVGEVEGLMQRLTEVETEKLELIDALREAK